MPQTHAERLAKKHAYYQKNRHRILAHNKVWALTNPEKSRAIQRKHYEANKAVIKARSKRRADADPAATKAYHHAYYEAHREEALAASKARQQADPEKNRLRRRAWARRNRAKLRLRLQIHRQNHPDIHYAARTRRRARKAEAPLNDLTAAQWREIVHAYDSRCAYCGRKMQRLTQDHITPLAAGGSHTASNIVPACASCNSRKNAGAPLVPVQPLLLTLAPPKKKTG